MADDNEDADALRAQLRKNLIEYDEHTAALRGRIRALAWQLTESERRLEVIKAARDAGRVAYHIPGVMTVPTQDRDHLGRFIARKPGWLSRVWAWVQGW